MLCVVKPHCDWSKYIFSTDAIGAMLCGKKPHCDWSKYTFSADVIGAETCFGDERVRAEAVALLIASVGHIDEHVCLGVLSVMGNSKKMRADLSETEMDLIKTYGVEG